MKNLSIKRLLHSLFLVSVIFPQLSFAISQITLSGVCGAIMTANNSGWEGVGSNFQAQMPNNAIPLLICQFATIQKLISLKI